MSEILISEIKERIGRRKAAIERERAAIQQSLVRLDQEEAALAVDEEELVHVIKTLERLSKIGRENSELKVENSPPTQASPTLGRPAEQVRPVARQKGSPRPEGIPSVPEMVDLLLQEAEKKGLAGLEPREILAGVDGRWWPGVAANDVLPTVYRTAAKGYWFEKIGSRFRRTGRRPPK